MSPLLQSAESVFSPPSFCAGKLLLPFLIVQVMEKSSMPPRTLPRILPFFAVSEIDFPAFIFSHTISPPFAFRLNTIQALRCMDLSLPEINEILSYDDFGKITEKLKLAEKSADEKIAELENAKLKIQRARAYYENKSDERPPIGDIFVRYFPERAILLSETMKKPTLDNLWNYHRHFYSQIPENRKNEFSFEDQAGIYEQNGQSHLFAVCIKYAQTDALKILPQGKYLCADCTEENRGRVMEKLLATAKREYDAVPEFSIQMIVLSGILQWNYQIQIFIP